MMHQQKVALKYPTRNNLFKQTLKQANKLTDIQTNKCSLLVQCILRTRQKTGQIGV